MIPLPTPLPPDAVMARIAAALPADCRQDVVVIGSRAKPTSARAEAAWTRFKSMLARRLAA